MSHARKLDHFIIKSFSLIHLHEIKNLCDDIMAILIARVYGSFVRTYLNTKVKIFQEMILIIYRLEICRGIIYVSKRLALRSIRGNHKVTYIEILKYATAVRNYNEQLITFVSSSTPLSSRGLVFKAFIASCRPYIRLDACHLWGPYRGVLFTVVTIDSNSMIFLLAIVIVDFENFNS